MRKLVLATVSAIALGLAGAGPLYAQTTDTGPAANPTAATNPSTAAEPTAPTDPTGAENPAAPAMPQAETATPGTANTMGAMSGHLGRMSRTEIKQIQSELRRDGLYRGHIDGIDGPQTHAALRGYQRHNGLRANGRLDHQTLATLLGSGAGMGSSMPPRNMGTSNGMNMPPSSNAGTAGPNNSNQ